MVERHRPHQRPEPQALRALSDGGKKNARRRRHAERRRMMLGEVIGIEGGAIIGLCDFEAVLVIVCERPRITVEVIEDAEFHLPSACQWADRATHPISSASSSFFAAPRCAAATH